MITLVDMRAALTQVRTEKAEVQARLRMAAAELVSCYCESLGVSPDKAKSAVNTGVLKNDVFENMPVARMEIGEGRALGFYLTTTIEDHVVSKFVVSISIALREKDDFVSVKVENDNVPILVLKEGVEARYSEAVEAIKCAVIEKIKHRS